MYREWALGIDGAAVIWTRDAETAQRSSRILPDGCIDLIWSEGRVMVAGPDTTARQVLTPGGTEYVGVRFSPGQAPAVLGVPASALRDSQPDLEDLWPGRGRRIADRVTHAADRRAELARLVRTELQRHPPDPLAREIAQRLRRGESVERVARAVGLSARHLRRHSLTAFGYGPKTLARVLRLDRAMSLARNGVALADVAASAGYADQAHFTRDVRALSGVTPRALLQGL